MTSNMWRKVFKNGPSIQQTISLQIFKDCLPLILLGPFMNTLPHVFLQLFKILQKGYSLPQVQFFWDFGVRQIRIKDF